MWKIEIKSKKQEWVNFKLENLSPSPPVKMKIKARDGRRWIQVVEPQKLFSLSWNGERFAGSSDYIKLADKYSDILDSLIGLLVVKGLYDFPVGFVGTFK